MIAIIHHLARSGGTLISKCLGSMQDIVMLSEVHPQTALAGPQYRKLLLNHDPIVQATRWFDLFGRDQSQAIAGAPAFCDQILLIEQSCRAQGKQLLIRDWSHLDFMARPFLPAWHYQLTGADLLRSHMPLCQVATIRHPADQWLSLCKLAILKDLSLAEFLYGYRRFVECCRGRMPIYRYEDFCANPDLVLHKICGQLRLGFDVGYRQRWADYQTITGDGSKQRHIRLPSRSLLEADLMQALLAHKDYRWICTQFDYPAALPAFQNSVAS